jgi:hypothetical protein
MRERNKICYEQHETGERPTSVKVQLHTFLTLEEVQVIGKLHVPVALLPRKEPPIPIK